MIEPFSRRGASVPGIGLARPAKDVFALAVPCRDDKRQRVHVRRTVPRLADEAGVLRVDDRLYANLKRGEIDDVRRTLVFVTSRTVST